jgi:fatty acid CoA ligase FadD9
MTENKTMGVADLERITAKLMGLFGSDQQFAAAMPVPAIADTVKAPGMRIAPMVAAVMEGYRDRPALGRRAHRLVTGEDGRTRREFCDHFDTISYAELWHRTGAVASAWRYDGPAAVNAGDFVCTIGSPGIDYTVLDLACIRMGAVAVPLPATGARSDLSAMLGEVEPTVLCAGIDALGLAVEAVLGGGHSPGQIVVFDYLPEVDEQREVLEATTAALARRTTVEVVTLAALIERGGRHPVVTPYVHEDDENPMVALLYTSGSTGSPKAAICTERMCAMAWISASLAPAIGLTYMPMSHFYGRGFLYTTLSGGGTNYFVTKGDLSTLFDDLAIIRPTSLPLVPRVCEMIAHRYHGEVARRVGDGMDRSAAEHDAKEFVRNDLLGGRYLWASCASAPLSQAMHELMEDLLDAPLVISYGATEIVGVTIDGVVSRPPVIDYKLVDVPELGYFGTDKPYPRGELLVKTENAMAGYYKRPELTAQTFDEDGYYRTGDIMAEIAPDRLMYVDRRNNVLKLAQGEFVAVSQLEAAFSGHPLIRQIFVYGNSEQSFLLAVVVPDAELGDAPHVALRRRIRLALNDIGREAGLDSWEIPRDFLIEPEPFTTENGLLTTSNKPARPQLTARYGARLERLYTELSDRAAERLRDLRSGSADRSVLDTVKRAVQVTLELPSDDTVEDIRFIDLGGDSLSALSLSTLLEDVFGVDVPVAEIIDPTTDLSLLADRISARSDRQSATPTFTSVHGAGTGRVFASDLTLDKFIDPELLVRARSAGRPADRPHTVLLTGANGFLGRFQCLAWMERLAAVGGRVICIARGSSDADARRRIEAATATDDALAQRFTELAGDHLEVLAGDLAAERLGLHKDDWDRLAEDVDTVVHTGALVNHLLPYRQLFGPNVSGTAEVLRLAITHRLKPVTFVSTVAAAITADGQRADEDADIRTVSAYHDLSDSYAHGYAVSKWAGEVLCREAHQRCGLPVAVFRCNMLLPHRTFVGQINAPDVVSRLLASVLSTGLAPGSFYTGDPATAHFDGLPVDFVADATVRIRPSTGLHTFNVVNPHRDAVSLDTFVDWLAEAGFRIHRIADYGEWFARVQTSLRDLPEHVRHYSLLNLPSAFTKPGVAMAGSAFTSDRFRSAVADHGLGGGEIPPVSRELVLKYATDLTRLGVLQA